VRVAKQPDFTAFVAEHPPATQIELVTCAAVFAWFHMDKRETDASLVSELAGQAPAVAGLALGLVDQALRDARRDPYAYLKQGSAPGLSVPTRKGWVLVCRRLPSRALAPSAASRLDALGLHPGLVKVSRALFVDGHYAQAVEEGAKALINLVRDKCGCTDRDGWDLMMHAFNEGKPILAVNAMQSDSERSEQRGYQHILAGVCAAIRNPLAHGNKLLADESQVLHVLCMLSHLFGVVDRSRVVEGT
jgi:uncharacterized protein (TIGR02391 family)